ncbi:SsrA-binding protein SmpB [Sneathiella sp. HT1-7]|jgi:SsrA-binding protein|uniref:SsrA-binding protein SmpB n=1 Tax=Sneathiella sp. HT1-7 TaxID=2887192 RepID=UPI001D159AE0|nr:SsrA-binding protein SmpB [Sneathiella sp. HT1-7]MCC3305060.1 SsrA-binding protein SmpB [Sneathiella sp. HT1-7]
MGRTIAENRKARYNYFIHEEFEAGMILLGTEVKSLRAGRANIQDAYASFENDGLYLINAHISEYGHGNRNNHDPLRPRQLLMHKKEIRKISGQIQKAGKTLVPLSMYFNDRGIAKVKVGLASGKKQHDKRATERDRDWGREKQRLLKSSV